MEIKKVGDLLPRLAWLRGGGSARKVWLDILLAVCALEPTGPACCAIAQADSSDSQKVIRAHGAISKYLRILALPQARSCPLNLK